MGLSLQAVQGGARKLGVHQEKQRLFVDALRAYLGFVPLYAPDKATNYLDEIANVWELAPGCRQACRKST
jgi:hypothetical protein